MAALRAADVVRVLLRSAIEGLDNAFAASVLSGTRYPKSFLLCSEANPAALVTLSVDIVTYPMRNAVAIGP
jgi:hypothetical protein